MTPLLTQFALLIIAALFCARRMVRDPVDRLLTAALLVWGGLVVLCLALSAMGKLGDPAWFFRGSLALALTLYLSARRHPGEAPSDPQPAAPPEERSQALIWAFGLTIIPLLCANLAVAAAYAPNNWDSLTYHLPRTMYYMGQGSLGHFDTDNYRQTFFPFNFNLLQLSCLIYSPPLQSVNFLNVAAWCVAGLAVFRIARLCGASFNASLAASWLALTSTQVFAQATATTNDLPTATAVLCAIAFALRWRQTRLARHALLAGGAAGLACGTKLTVIFFAPAAGLLAVVLLRRVWRQDGAANLRARLRSWILPAVLAAVLCAPFALINLAESGQWMTKAYDFTLNRPFAPGCALQTGEAYLAQLFLDPLQRFSFDLDRTGRLNAWADRVLFPHWNEAYAFSPRYIFPPDVNEDHVWFGFAGPLALLCGAWCVWRSWRLNNPASWLGLLGVGWFAAYFLLNKWSLYNQRYFVPPLLLLTPCLAASFDAWRAGPGLPGRLLRLLAWAVAATSLWFAAAYLIQNSHRPLPPLLTAALRPQVLPALPPAMTPALAAQTRINIITEGTNERIFLLMGLGTQQRFTSARSLDDSQYNLFSFWGFTRNYIYSNIAHFYSSTLVPVPAKRTAGIEPLGTIGHGVTAFDYYGLPPHAGRTPASSTNRNVLVALYYATKEPDRFAHCTVKVAGLNPEDNARLALDAELADGRIVPLASLPRSGKADLSITAPFRRVLLRLTDSTDGRIIGSGELPYKTLENVADAAGPASENSLFLSDLITPGRAGPVMVRGLANPEGPYPQWDLPVFRWAREPTVRLEILPLERLGRLRLSFSCRLQVRDEARLQVLHNGKPVEEFLVLGRTAWQDKIVEVAAAQGANVFELRDVSAKMLPDWAAYLEKNQDVKDWLVSQGTPLEQGAREHYESHGRKENRVLPMRLDPAGTPPPADSLYFTYRSLRVEGLTPPSPP